MHLMVSYPHNILDSSSLHLSHRLRVARKRVIMSTTTKSLFIFLLLFLTFFHGDGYKQQELDRITVLPGQPKVGFAQFSGYVTVNEKHGRALFYWLIEATSEPEKKPLVLWLNGGPGCSSIAYGASEEIGPFFVKKSGSSLYLNSNSWNKEANLLFLESPVGVGFSYTNTSSDLKDAGDKRTAHDAWVFMKKWISRFPQYKYRDFYISGESYAGHYVPQLAKRIHDYNKAHNSKPYINLKGFIVGNAVTDNYYDNIGTVMYWWSHSMISDHSYRSIISLCNFKSSNVTEACNRAVYYVFTHEFGNIDQYSIYTPTCMTSKANSTRSVRLKNTLLRRRVSGYDPCTEHYAEKYFNNPNVQKAMHANLTSIPYKWTACSDVLIKNWQDSSFSILPIYKELISAGLRIWVFSGDTDSVVPVTATRFSLAHLNLTVKTPWYPWYSNGQVAGWTEVYKGLTFATVRGAGHEVPLFQPKRGFGLFRAFLAGKQLPRS